MRLFAFICALRERPHHSPCRSQVAEREGNWKEVDFRDCELELTKVNHMNELQVKAREVEALKRKLTTAQMLVRVLLFSRYWVAFHVLFASQYLNSFGICVEFEPALLLFG